MGNDQQRRQLDMQASRGESGSAEVRITLDSNPGSYTAWDERIGTMHRDLTTIFPPLPPPPGMTMRGGGGGGGGSAAVHSSTTLYGELSHEVIEQHYRQLLTSAGWREIGHGASGAHAWSTWEFIENTVPWVALLTVIAPPSNSQQRLAGLQASAIGMPGPPKLRMVLG
jgi:hypothetical protein